MMNKCVSASSVSDIVPSGMAYVADFATSSCSSSLSKVTFYKLGAVLDFGIYSSSATCSGNILNVTSCNKVFGQCNDYDFRVGQCANGVYAACP
jgi:hypothetical protein